MKCAFAGCRKKYQFQQVVGISDPARINVYRLKVSREFSINKINIYYENALNFKCYIFPLPTLIVFSFVDTTCFDRPVRLSFCDELRSEYLLRTIKLGGNLSRRRLCKRKGFYDAATEFAPADNPSDDESEKELKYAKYKESQIANIRRR